MRPGLLLKNLLFTLLVPGTVAVYVPYVMGARYGSLAALGWPRFLMAAPFFLLGAALYGWCVWDFATLGRGTPAPIDPPRELVAHGPYRYVRNPMYLAVLCVILAWVVLAPSRPVALYGLVVALAMHTFVLLVEEPQLQRRFGAAYDMYRRKVRRWMPGRARRLSRRELAERDFGLPAWAEVGRRRREHIERVAALLLDWAERMDISDAERDRWLKAAWLHDALRDARLAQKVTHGGAAADRAAQDGEKDQGVLDAIRYHSTGFAGWDEVGKMLYLADYLEPGRRRNGKERSRLADRVPRQRDRILRKIVAYEIRWRVRKGRPVHPLTIEFWNALSRD
ncbi:MAG TPA: methyltransferase [Gemmatimonadales bacterium]|nr:methyltransferase [Gemmatimonadales bacterium]